MKNITIMIIIAFIVFGVFVPTAQATSLYGAMVQYRTSKVLKPIAANDNLYKSAYNKARDIAEGKKKWEHGNWKADIQKYYKFRWAGEILARDFGSFNDTLQAWNQSPSHAVILNSNQYCEIGIAQYAGVIVAHYGCR